MLPAFGKNKTMWKYSIRHFYQKITKCERKNKNNSSTLAACKAFSSTLHQIWSILSRVCTIWMATVQQASLLLNNVKSILFRISILSIRSILFDDGAHDSWWSLFFCFYCVAVHSKVKEIFLYKMARNDGKHET